MATFRELSDEIQEELGGDGSNDLSTIVDNEIIRAIAAFKHKPFATTYGQNTDLTSADGTATYTLPSPVRAIDEVEAAFNGSTNKLIRRNYAWYTTTTANQTTITGEPHFFVVYGRQLILYPTPTSAETITISGSLSPTPDPFVPVTNDDDSNFWTEDENGLPLIKARVKFQVYNNRNSDPINAATERDNEGIAMKMLLGRIENTMLNDGYQPEHWF